MVLWRLFCRFSWILLLIGPSSQRRWRILNQIGPFHICTYNATCRKHLAFLFFFFFKIKRVVILCAWQTHTLHGHASVRISSHCSQQGIKNTAAECGKSFHSMWSLNPLHAASSPAALVPCCHFAVVVGGCEGRDGEELNGEEWLTLYVLNGAVNPSSFIHPDQHYQPLSVPGCPTAATTASLLAVETFQWFGFWS